MCEFGCRATVGRRIAEVVGTTVKIEDGSLTRDFGHEPLVMLSFSEIRAETVRGHAGAIACPFSFYRVDIWQCVLFPAFFHVVHSLDQDVADVMFRRSWYCDL